MLWPTKILPVSLTSDVNNNGGGWWKQVYLLSDALQSSEFTRWAWYHQIDRSDLNSDLNKNKRSVLQTKTEIGEFIPPFG